MIHAQIPPPTPRIARYDAAAIADAREITAHGSLLVEFDSHGCATVLARGRREPIDHHPAAPSALVYNLSATVVIPGLVNAHTHLDLTHIGPRPHDAAPGFVPWIELIRKNRATDDASIQASVRRGAELALAGGTAAVGDIGGAPGGRPTLAPWRALRTAGLAGVSFLEFFAIGPRHHEAQERIRLLLELHADEIAARHPVRLGLQPHAPNTVIPAAYRHAVELASRFDLPLATHLAESPEESLFIAEARGPQRALLDRLGAWHDDLLQVFGHARHPVEHLRDALRSARFLAAHVNDAPDAAIELLARTSTAVAYCPRASAYFGAHRRFGPHRYRDMLAAGVNVALGTDSIVNLPPAAADPARAGISILDEMRLLWARDGTDAGTLLAMGTVNGAAALGLDPGAFLLQPGSHPIALIGVDAPGEPDLPPMDRALRGDHPPRVLWRGN